MSTKHTPAPWKILKGHTGQNWFICYHSRKDAAGKVIQRTEAATVYKGLRLVKNGNEEGLALASVDAVGINYRANKTINDAEAEANARLIAKSPEMLAFALAVVSTFNSHTDGYARQVLRGLAEQATALIDAAEGRKS